MKKLFSKIFVLAILLNATYVFSDEGLYVSSNIGIGIAVDGEFEFNNSPPPPPSRLN